jgi:uncharacterized protein (DUF1697 family)
MAVIVSLLRGVNVGGHNKIKMDALRTLYESLGLGNPVTYVQSGNVVFTTEQTDLPELASMIAGGIQRSFGFRPEVILRTISEIRDVLAKNPFLNRNGLDPSKLLVLFLINDPGALETLRTLETDGEEVVIHGREVYIYFPDGMGRSKLPALLASVIKAPATGRNWRTVTKLSEIAERLEAFGGQQRDSSAAATRAIDKSGSVTRPSLNSQTADKPE